MSTLKKHTISICLISILLLSGCITKKSIVYSSADFHPVSSKEAIMNQCRIGLIMNQSLADEKARFVTQKGGLKYDFEFKIGLDVLNTFPAYIGSRMDVVLINNYNEENNFCFVIEPKISNSLFIYTGLSAAPRYELSITMDVPVMKKGILQKRLYAKKDSKVTILAFENTDDKRTETMKLAYEEQLVLLYNEIDDMIREYIKTKPQ